MGMLQAAGMGRNEPYTLSGPRVMMIDADWRRRHGAVWACWEKIGVGGGGGGGAPPLRSF